MKFRNETYIGVLIAVVVIAGSFFSGFYVGAQGDAAALGAQAFLPRAISANVDEKANLSTFWQVWNLLNEKYVRDNGNSTSTKETTLEEKIWGATEGLVGSLGDPYTTFFPPEQAKLFDDDIAGNFEGVGMEIGIKNDTLTVVSPLKDSPAARAGIKAGDKIVGINGEPASAKKVEEAVKLIRGKKGTSVVITILREGLSAPKDISIVRDVITIPSIDIEEKSEKIVNGKVQDAKESNLQNGVYVVRLFNFGAQSAGDFERAMSTFSKSGSQKLVIDLRGNPGGYLEAAVDIASWFIPKGEPVVLEQSGGTGERRKDSVYESFGYDLPANVKNAKVAVLVDRGSASASEILAGALQEYGKARIIGEKTFGKGSVQELVHLADGSSVKITIARWFTPKGRSISLSGLDPDISVVLTEQDLKDGKDPQMARAIEYLNTGK